MKTYRSVFLIIVLAAICLPMFSGCAVATVQKVNADLKAFEQLGLKEIVITGKFSHTDYTVTTENGVRRAIINHTNAWVPQIKIVRETPEPAK